MKNLEFKTFEFKDIKVKENKEENKGTIEGYASTFGNMDLGFDIVDKGAFKNTIKTSGVKWPILADHNAYTQIGWNLEAEEDSKGLSIVGQIDLNIEKGKERYSLAKTAQEIGARFGLSIGYTTIKAEPDATNNRVRRLKELKMWEYSMVTFPMNTEALITAAKSMGAVEKATFLIEQLKAEGVSIKDFEMALRKEAADKDYDPTKISQSISNLIEVFRS